MACLSRLITHISTRCFLGHDITLYILHGPPLAESSAHCLIVSCAGIVVLLKFAARM